MEQGPLQSIAAETPKIIRPVAAPIWFDSGERVLNGTCALLQLARRRVGVTCHHVLEEGEGDPVLAGFRTSRDRVLDQCPELDLAIIDLDGEPGDKIEAKGQCRFHESTV